MKREEEEQTLPEGQKDPSLSQSESPPTNLGQTFSAAPSQIFSQAPPPKVSATKVAATRFNLKTPPPKVSATKMSATRFNLTARTDAEIHAASRRIPQDNRPKDPVALAKLRARATIGIDPPFTLLDLDNTDLTLQHTYNVSMRVQSFEYVLTQYDMIDAFKVHLFQPDVQPPVLLDDGDGNPITINLLTHHSSLTEHQVRKYILFLKRYGQTYDVQNLDWTQELFNNSCNADLRDKVNEKVLGVHPFEIAGPLLFYHAMTLNTTQTADAVRALTLRVTNLKLGDIQGENVGTAISQMRGALLRLKALDKIPNDLLDKILNTMQTLSVEKFNQFFETLASSCASLITPITQKISCTSPRKLTENL